MSNSKIEVFKDMLIENGDSALMNAKYMSMTAYEVIDAYQLANLPLPIKIIENTWLPMGVSKHGWGNGYVKIVPGNKFFQKHYDDIDVNVHGGLTFSEDVKDDSFDSPGYWIGFDTAHYNDNLENWPKSRVFEETMDLFRQVYHLK